VAGGYRLTDPAADLAVAAALVSALADRPLPSDTAWFGEVSLAGEVRPVAHSGVRLRDRPSWASRRSMGLMARWKRLRVCAFRRSVFCQISLTG
jgi:predicted ATP-dependent serine protease